MSWQIWVLLSGVLSGIAQGIGKRQVGRMSSFQSGVLRDASTLAVVLLVYLWQGVFSWSGINILFVLVGLVEAIMMAAYYSAAREEMAGTVIFSYPMSSILIVVGSGVLFGEWKYFDLTSMRGWLNILVLILMIVLIVSYQGKKVKNSRWSTKLTLSALMVVVANLVQKWAVAVVGLRPASYMIYEYLGLVLGGVVFVFGRGQDLKVGKKQVWWGAMQGVLFAISALMYVEMLRQYPLSISSMIRRVAIVTVTAGSGLSFFGEGKRLRSRQIWSLVAGVAILMIVLGVNG